MNFATTINVPGADFNAGFGAPDFKASSASPFHAEMARSSTGTGTGTTSLADPHSSYQASPSPSSEPSLHIPDSPAAQGYLANPFRDVVEQAHAMLNEQLDSVTDEDWHCNAKIDEDVAILASTRDPNRPSNIPFVRGRSFIPDCRPIEVLACVHLFSYRLVWDTRMSSGRILQRYGYHSFLFYSVWRGVGPIYSPRDAVGIQDVRCWGPQGQAQQMALPNTERIDCVWRSTESSEVPPQQGKVRMQVDLGAYRLEWIPDPNGHVNGGTQVTFVGQADVRACIPSYLWKVLSMELPKVVGRLKGAIQRFGIPPYVLDLQGCCVIQTTFYYGETRRTTHRHHVRKPGSYNIMIDRQQMFSYGMLPPKVSGPGAFAVSLQESHDAVIVNVAPAGVGQEYIIEIQPRDVHNEHEASNGYW